MTEITTIPSTSNWFIPDKILFGAYPDPRTNNAKELAELGVTIFISLQTLKESLTFEPYIEQVLHVNKLVEFIQFPIEDRCIARDDSTCEFIKSLVQLVDNLKEKQLIYIHCYGGHGRTGTIASLLYSHLNKCSGTEAMKYVQIMHDTRLYKGKTKNQKCPQTAAQIKQVLRLAYA